MMEVELFLGFIDGISAAVWFALAAVSTGVSIVQQEKAQDKQEDAAKAQLKADQERSRRARLRTRRETLIKAANITASAASQEGISSAAAGGVGSVFSQGSASLGSQSFISTQNTIAGNALTKARGFQQNAVLAQNIANLSIQGGMAAGGGGAKKTTTKTTEVG
jgi:hypothetical protein